MFDVSVVQLTNVALPSMTLLNPTAKRASAELCAERRLRARPPPSPQPWRM